MSKNKQTIKNNKSNAPASPKKKELRYLGIGCIAWVALFLLINMFPGLLRPGKGLKYHPIGQSAIMKPLPEDITKAIYKAAEKEKSKYEIKVIRYDGETIYIQIISLFKPSSDSDISSLTDELTENVAEITNHEKSVDVAMLHSIPGKDSYSAYGHSVYYPGGRIRYRWTLFSHYSK
ncbi:MAG: hypothetical protein ACYC27_08020 [Armatimonadota bacterium]